MRIILNDKQVIIPSSLSEMTLGQRIDFYNQYGRELDTMLTSILEMPDSSMKEIELTEFSIEKMFRTFAFFAGVTPQSLKESEFVDEIAKIYYSSLKTVFDDEADLKIEPEYLWRGDIWKLHAPILQNGSRMKFGEFIDSKQVVKDMIELSAGRWEMLLRLCAIYLRKDGEQYQEAFLYEGSERMQLFRELPMNIALGVGFFLSSSMNISIHTLESFSHQQLKQDQPEKSTLSVGAGSTS